VTLQYLGNTDLFSGKVPTTGTLAGHVLIMDQRPAFTTSAGWIDLSAILNGPGSTGLPQGSKLGMAVSGNDLTFDVLDTAGDDKQLNCTVSNAHTLVAGDCAATWTTLPGSS
jgi:hypothetical protein